MRAPETTPSIVGDLLERYPNVPDVTKLQFMRLVPGDNQQQCLMADTPNFAGGKSLGHFCSETPLL